MPLFPELKIKIRPCPCGSGLDSDWQYDGRGIPLCRTCSACHASRMKGYRPEILEGYDQGDVDEPVEPEDYY